MNSIKNNVSFGMVRMLFRHPLFALVVMSSNNTLYFFHPVRITVNYGRVALGHSSWMHSEFEMFDWEVP